jgi:hypothetical protein
LDRQRHFWARHSFLKKGAFYMKKIIFIDRDWLVIARGMRAAL